MQAATGRQLINIANTANRAASNIDGASRAV